MSHDHEPCHGLRSCLRIGVASIQLHAKFLKCKYARNTHVHFPRVVACLNALSIFAVSHKSIMLPINLLSSKNLQNNVKV